MQLVVHSPFGSRINRAWGLALRKRFCVTFDFELQAAATDDGIVISLGPQHSFPLDSVFAMVRRGTLRDDLAQAVLASWTFEPGLALGLVALAALYARGWWVLRRQMPERFPALRIACFLAGLATIFVAGASPLDAFAGLLLQVHMVQRLLLMVVAPPLLLLGAPAVVLLRGLPPRFAKEALGPFLAWPALWRAADFITHPVVCWSALVLTTIPLCLVLRASVAEPARA